MNSKFFNALREKVDFIDFPEPYTKLFTYLFNKEFRYILSMDRNRAEDGIQLRRDICTEIGCRPSAAPCNMLEFLVALCIRMNYISSAYDENRVKELFWHLMSNLGVSYMDDTMFEKSGGVEHLDNVFEVVLNRTYDTNGNGGLFPMAAPRQNQRNVEIWYQMNQYLSDPNGEGLKSY